MPHKPKRQLKKILQAVNQVTEIEHISHADAVWTWGETATHTLGRHFSVLVWNVWKQAGGELFERDFYRLLAGVDIGIFQELLLDFDFAADLGELNLRMTHAGTYRRKDGKRDGVMTLARAMNARPSVRVMSKKYEPILKTTKAALISYYKIEGSQGLDLAVCNIHAPLIRSPKQAASDLELIVETLELHEGPILFAGDFNTFSRPYLLRIDEALAKLGLERKVLKEDPRVKLAQLDHVYLRGLRAISAEVITSTVSSDHFPLVCQLQLDHD
jgi:endonuclease/exonuclease/phosphatase (EEP) superfamily protein YafD